MAGDHEFPQTGEAYAAVFIVATILVAACLIPAALLPRTRAQAAVEPPALVH